MICFLYSFEMFENIAYIRAKHADNNIPDNPEDWLDEFSTFSIYQALPELIKLWGLNVQTQVESKKTSTERTGNDNPSVPSSLSAGWAVHQGA